LKLAGVAAPVAEGVYLAVAAMRIAARSPVADIESSEDADPEAVEPAAKRQQRLVQRR
jgi:hypothetical protein